MTNDRDAIRRRNEQKKLRFESDLIRYHEHMSEWNSLSNKERWMLDKQAEKSNLSFWTLLGICVATFFAVRNYLSVRYSGDDLWIYSSIGFVVSCVVILPFAKFIGRIIRGALMGGLLCVIAFLLLTVVPRIFTSEGPSLQLVRIVSIGLGVLAFIGEWGGAYHASARPKRPSPPSLE